MGASKSAKEFAVQIDKYQKSVAKIGPTAVRLTVNAAKANAERAVSQATGGSSRLRNAGSNVRAGGRVVGKSGANLSVATYNITDSTSTVRAVGPWQLIEYDTKRHFIGAAGLSKAELGIGFEKSKSGRNTIKGRAGRSRVVRTPFGPRRYVEVRGTRGKKPWHIAYERTAAGAAQGLQKAADVVIGKI